jgi:hypothetical protein
MRQKLWVWLVLLATPTFAAGCGSVQREDATGAAKKTGGIGAMVRVDSQTGALAIDKLATKGAAAAAGVQLYDLIWSIDGTATVGAALEESVARLQGPLKSKVKLKVGASEAEAREIVVTRAELPADVKECLEGDCQDGTGTSVDRFGERYEGSFKGGNYDGQGKLVEPSGRSYEGGFVQGAASGQGVYVSASGVRVEGTFEGGYPQGVVKMTLKDGDFYEGETKDFTMHGQGNYHRPSTGDVWEGHYEYDKLVAGSWLHYPQGVEGRSCVREVKDGVVAATGTITYPANDPQKRVTFVGAFGDDCVANGEGLMTYKRKKMQGPFLNDEPQKGAKNVR